MKTVSSCLKQISRVRLAQKELVGSAGRDKALSRPTSRIGRMQIVLLVSAGYNGS
jgi:hypothetical protein